MLKNCGLQIYEQLTQLYYINDLSIKNLYLVFDKDINRILTEKTASVIMIHEDGLYEFISQSPELFNERNLPGVNEKFTFHYLSHINGLPTYRNLEHSRSVVHDLATKSKIIVYREGQLFHAEEIRLLLGLTA